MSQAVEQGGCEKNGAGAGGAALPADVRRDFERGFAEDGYYVFKNVVPREELSSLRKAIIGAFDKARNGEGLFAGGGLISGHVNCFPGEASRRTYEAVRDAGIIDLMRNMLPPDRRDLRVSCNLNLPKSVAQHYHEDYNPNPAGFFIVNVAVEDTTLVNGAIDLVPGTHKKKYEYWRFALERPHRHHQRIPMNQGDVLVRGSTLWHRGMPNRATAPRPMVAFTLGENVPAGDPFGFYEGKVTFQPNWYRPTFLGRLRERIFVAAPISYSAYRFVKSLLPHKGAAQTY